jgi:hypothetical protein
MKRIIRGRTYNTDTATHVAHSRYFYSDNVWEEATEHEANLYLTRGGAFFAVVTKPDEDASKATIEPMTWEDAEKWVMESGETELYDESVFAAPPEAGEEAEPEATLYLRVPRALKERIEAHAKEADISLNSWAMRCLERCMAST